MPLYFLHQRRGSSVLRDEEGAEFADLSEAREEALQAARELIAGSVKTSGKLDLSPVFEIVGLDGKRLAEVPFEDAVTLLHTAKA
jgi:hypothetical protein